MDIQPQRNGLGDRRRIWTVVRELDISNIWKLETSVFPSKPRVCSHFSIDLEDQASIQHEA